MNIWASPYELRPRASLNRFGGGGRRGSLLKFEFPEGVGYADLHPWTELGDASLNEQLASLREGRPLALAARSMELAHVDARARSRGVSAFAGRAPKNHFLVTDLSAFDGVVPPEFSTVKLKVGRQVEAELAALRKFESAFDGLNLRLDFNGALNPPDFIAFLEAMPAHLKIEFVEDPVPYDSYLWSNLQARVSLALDRVGAKPTGGFKWLIFKPAVQSADWITSLAREHRARVAVTSYMDHPLGQTSAAYEAHRFAGDLIGVCGLLSQNIYEPSAYLVKSDAAEFMPPDGTGFGYDELLEREPWKAL